MILLGNRYTVKKGIVHWRFHPVPQADPATFRHLGGDWGQDAKRVFVQNKVKKLDFATFQYMNPVYTKDVNNLYDWEGAIKGADAETFEVLDAGVIIAAEITSRAWACGYARDRNAVYFHDQMFGRATALRGADPATFVSLRNRYGHDAESVWFDKSRIPKANPKTWVHLGRGWSIDGERVFYGTTEVAGVDAGSFTVVAAPTVSNLAADCQRFYENHLPIPESEFWKEVSENFTAFENRLRVAYQRLRNTCTTCSGSGDCFCKRKGFTDEP